MGCRRRRSASGLEVEPRLLNSLQLRRWRCRAFSTRGCGIVFCFAVLFASCHSSNETPALEEITIAFPEGTGVAADRGARQVARSLALEGLTQVAPDGRVIARLASEWRWIGDREFRIRILPNILLHDGRTLTASVLTELLEPLIADPDAISTFPSFADIESLRAVNDTELAFTLSRHSSWLPEDLSTSLDFGVKGEKQIGTGPYQFTDGNGSDFFLTSFDKYHGGRPGIRRVVVKTEATLRTAWASLLRGDLEMVADLPPDTVELIRNENVRIIPFTRAYQYVIGLSFRSAKFADPRVRQALNMAIDRPTIVNNVLKGSGRPSNGPLWYGHWAFDPSIGNLQYAPKRAAELLQEAGLPVRPSSNPALPPARLRLTCLVPEGFIVYEHLALELQRQLSAVGVDIRFEVQPFSTYDKRLSAGDFEAVLVDIASGPGLSRSSIFWRSPRRPHVLRTFGYENPATEALFENLRGASSDTEVRSITRELQQAFSDNPPAIFLAWNERARTVRGDFDIEVQPGTDPLPRLWQWGTGASSQVAAR